MNVIRIDLPLDLEQIEIHSFADEHIGDSLSSVDRLKERIDYVERTPNAYCILNGDLMDNATRTSVGDTYTQVFNPMAQLEKAVELFGCIKDKILCVTDGNHENRTYRTEGIKLSKLIAVQLGISELYSPEAACIFLRLGHDSKHEVDRRIAYTLYVTHGSVGGRKEGAKAIRLADMANIIDTDIYVMGHTHLPMTMRESFFRVDQANRIVRKVDKLFVNTASNLDYGGYGEAKQFKPSSMESPVIILSGTKKQFSARI